MRSPDVRHFCVRRNVLVSRCPVLQTSLHACVHEAARWCPQSEGEPESAKALAVAARQAREVEEAGLLLRLPFDTLFEYLQVCLVDISCAKLV